MPSRWYELQISCLTLRREGGRVAVHNKGYRPEYTATEGRGGGGGGGGGRVGRHYGNATKISVDVGFWGSTAKLHQSARQSPWGYAKEFRLRL